jgi:hypothetical protein
MAGDGWIVAFLGCVFWRTFFRVQYYVQELISFSFLSWPNRNVNGVLSEQLHLVNMQRKMHQTVLNISSSENPRIPPLYLCNVVLL